MSAEAGKTRVTDEMVEAGCHAQWAAERAGFNQHGAMRAALEASLALVPAGGETRGPLVWSDMPAYGDQSFDQLAEAVAWRWIGGDEPDVWSYSERALEPNARTMSEPLYAAPPSSERAGLEPQQLATPVALWRHVQGNNWLEVQPAWEDYAFPDKFALYATPPARSGLEPATIEACAKIADDHALAWGLAMGTGAREIAKAIRALDAYSRRAFALTMAATPPARSGLDPATIEACAMIADDEADAMLAQRDEILDHETLGGRIIKSGNARHDFAKERRVLADGFQSIAKAIRALAQEGS